MIPGSPRAASRATAAACTPQDRRSSSEFEEEDDAISLVATLAAAL
jgi:hypothetical protein